MKKNNIQITLPNKKEDGEGLGGGKRWGGGEMK